MTNRPPRKVSNLISYFQDLSNNSQEAPSSTRVSPPTSVPARIGAAVQIGEHASRISYKDLSPRPHSKPSETDGKMALRPLALKSDLSPSPTVSTALRLSLQPVQSKPPLRKHMFLPQRPAPTPPASTSLPLLPVPTPAVLVPATVLSLPGQSTKVQVAAPTPERETRLQGEEAKSEDPRNGNTATLDASLRREETQSSPPPPVDEPLIQTALCPPSPVVATSNPSSYFAPPTKITPTSIISRPSLVSKDSASQSCATSTSNRTVTIPAASIFNSTAEPLHLPELDKYLDKLPEYTFTDVEEKGFMSDLERKSWENWLESGEKLSRGATFFEKTKRAFSFSFLLSWLEKLRGKGNYADLEKAPSQTLNNSVAVEERSDIFIPMNLIPPHLTVADLQANRGREPLLTVSQVIGVLTDGFLGAEGSSIGIEVETVESFRDMIQIITLLLTSSPNSISLSSWYHTIFVDIPSTISLDFVSAFGMAVLWYWVFTLIAAVAMYEFVRFTGGWRANLARSIHEDLGEGLDKEANGATSQTWKKRLFGWRDSRGYKMLITFILSTLYLPLSKIAIGALVWTSDFWAIPNPYLTTDNPTLPSLGPSSTFYNPLDFCYKTSMIKPVHIFEHFNWAWVILPVAAGTVGWLTIWFPWRVHLIIRRSAPTVDQFTQVGAKRKDMEGEYRRLLDYDRSAFNFLYRGAYLAMFGTCGGGGVPYNVDSYSISKGVSVLQSYIINVLLVCVLTKNNCLFRNYSTASLSVIREASLTCFLSLFLIADLISKPYLDYTSNSSDIVSRIGYVVMALIGLLVSLNVKGKDALSGPILIISDVIVYSLNAYFALIGTNVCQRIVKQLQKRLDFSIDLFSPHLNFPKHISTRIWQETMSVVLFASPEFKFVTDKGRLRFLERDHVAPYLLDFDGTQAERHSENLQILRHIGHQAYAQAARHDLLHDKSETVEIQRWIERYYTGPDIYWEPSSGPTPQNVVSHFGRLDVLPFPFTCVFRYDEAPKTLYHLASLEDLQRLVNLNEQPSTRERRHVRLALRALEGQTVLAPHVEKATMEGRGHIQVESRLSFHEGVLSIARNSNVTWRGYNYSSGFRVSIHYSDGRGQNASGKILNKQTLKLTAKELDIPLDFSLTPSIARLLHRNRTVIDMRLPSIEGTLERHRAFFAGEAAKKHTAMSYSLLLNTVLLPRPISVQELRISLSTTETSPQLLNLPTNHCAAVAYASERFRAVTRSQVSQFWYLFFDDLWRRNAYVVSDLAKRPSTFSPYYKSSICYRPMSRMKLEALLSSANLLVGNRGYFNAGILNKLYFYLDEVVFRGTQRAIPLHVGHTATSIPFDKLDAAVPSRARRMFDVETLLEHSYTLSEGTGDGTDYDDDVIRTRRAFTYEEIFDRPQPKWSDGKVIWLKSLLLVQAKEAIIRWLGLKPFRHAYPPSDEDGVTMELRHGDEGWEVPHHTLKGDG